MTFVFTIALWPLPTSRSYMVIRARPAPIRSVRRARPSRTLAAAAASVSLQVQAVVGPPRAAQLGLPLLVVPPEAGMERLPTQSLPIRLPVPARPHLPSPTRPILSQKVALAVTRFHQPLSPWRLPAAVVR